MWKRKCTLRAEGTFDQREPQIVQEVGQKGGASKLLQLPLGHGTRQKPALQEVSNHSPTTLRLLNGHGMYLIGTVETHKTRAGPHSSNTMLKKSRQALSSLMEVEKEKGHVSSVLIDDFLLRKNEICYDWSIQPALST